MQKYLRIAPLFIALTACTGAGEENYWESPLPPQGIESGHPFRNGEKIKHNGMIQGIHCENYQQTE